MKLSCVFNWRWLAFSLLGPSALAQSNATPVVRLELVERDAGETLIYQNAIFWGEFRVVRTGQTNGELRVFLNTQQGSARLGEDYWLDGVDDGSTVLLRAGESAVNVRLYPIDDDFYEGDETVFFHLIAPPYMNPLPPPYEIDFAHSSVEMVIHDNDPITTRLDITAPRDGEHFEAGDVIELRAQIIGPGSSNSWVIDFFDGAHLIGRTIPSGAIWWRDATGGRHAITARARNAAGEILEAGPVVISIGPGPALPVVSIVTFGFGKTAEPCPTCLVAPGVFSVSRTGPTNEALNVYLRYDGTATPETDYKELPGQITIPAGTNSTRVLVLPHDDLLVEGPEIVRATLAQPELADAGYIVNHYANEAMAVIYDDEPGAPEIRLDIVQPQEGAQFGLGTAIQISALAVWTQDEVNQPVQFFAGDTFIGQSDVTFSLRPTIPGLPSVHAISWASAPVGHHALTARFARGSITVTSPPVNIVVGPSPLRPIVSIEATSPIAEESSYPYRRLPLRGEFTVSRTGPTNESLLVFIHYSGTATPAVDVRDLGFLLSIPAGATSTTIAVEPVDDGIVEGVETLVAAPSECPPLTDPPLGMPCYYAFDVDPAHSRATVFIADNALTRTSITITSPKNGAEFDAGDVIPIETVAIDLDGYVTRVEFFANDRKIGESNVEFIRPPEPGQPQTFTFLWRYAEPGRYALTARATDNEGAQTTSAPVEISLGTSEPLPIVTVSAPDAFAVEPAVNTDLNTATFRIRRYGPTNNVLSIAYSLGGTAANGVDYERLSGLATIPAGQRSALVIVRPRADDLREGIETVRVSLDDPGSDATYRLGRRRAAAAISDHAWFGSARCLALPEGLKHLCFPAETGYNFRIECTTDFRTWRTLFDAPSRDNAWHFIDSDADPDPYRFYRLTVEPLLEPDDQ